MRKRLKKEARVRRRKRRSRMTFLSTLAHHLRKWLAPKRLLEVSQAGRQSESLSSHPLAVLPVCLPAFPFPAAGRKETCRKLRQTIKMHSCALT